ncbi:hypothetical protein [Microvirga sp. 17 mud 1-3]|uniref:hypothetical protein n=1 Tax=Microvirga sp. 17 mud 1-3 TaxID=2082949 RepID=UPI0013A536E0|nr:hypothetical protein [Microvirga sp. 17 mud 1-3]
MNDSTEASGRPALTGVLDRLHEARLLRARIDGLQALLRLQQQQIERLHDRVSAGTPGGIAAQRLLALKQGKRS